MMKSICAGAAILLLTACAPSTAEPDPLATIEHELDFLFGEWVGTASGIGSDRQPYEVTQTERVGPMLGGDIIMIEGRGYLENGETGFNALGIVAQTGPDGAWEMRSFTEGRAGTFPFEPRENGFRWSIPAGPNAVIRYTATIEGDRWTQIGEYLAENTPPVQTFSMDLTRVGDTDWPRGGAVDPTLPIE